MMEGQEGDGGDQATQGGRGGKDWILKGVGSHLERRRGLVRKIYVFLIFKHFPLIVYLN